MFTIGHLYERHTCKYKRIPASDLYLREKYATSYGRELPPSLSPPRPAMLSFVLAFVDLCLLPTFTQNIYFYIIIRPPSRKRNTVIFYDNKKAKEEETVEKKRSKTAKKRYTNTLKPILVEPLPKLLH
jgi:hypothetical protein